MKHLVAAVAAALLLSPVAASARGSVYPAGVARPALAAPADQAAPAPAPAAAATSTDQARAQAATREEAQGCACHHASAEVTPSSTDGARALAAGAGHAACLAMR